MSHRKENAIVGLVLLPLMIIMFADRWLAGGSVYFSIIEEGFPLVSNYPWDRFAASCLRAGRFPLWNPYQSGGTTFLANYLPAFFFLPRWILYLTDAVWLRDFYVLSRFWLGGLLLFVFLRRISVKAPGASLAVAAFLTGGYFTRYYNENYLNIDLMLGLWLLAGERLARKPDSRSFIYAVMAISAIILGGHPEAAFHALGFMGLWALYRSRLVKGGKRRFRPVILFVGAGLCAGLLSSAQLATFIEAWSHSTNYHVPHLGVYHYTLNNLASLVYPWLYGEFPVHLAAKSAPVVGRGFSYSATSINWLPYYLGVIPVFLAGYAVLELRKCHSQAAFFAVYGSITVAAVFGLPPFNELLALPPLDRLGNYKHLFPEITLCVAALAGMGLDRLLTEKKGELPRLLALFAGLTFLGVYGARESSGARYFYVLKYGLLPLGGVLAIWVAGQKGLGTWISALLIIGSVCAMGVLYAGGYRPKNRGYFLGIEKAPFVEYLKENAKPGDRYTSLYPPLFPAFGTMIGVEDIRGHDALQPKDFWNLLNEVNGLNFQDGTAFYQEMGSFAPLPEALGDKRMEDMRLKYIISPGDLGGVIAVNAIRRQATVWTPTARHFHWSVWSKNGERRPVLYTHPPLKFRYDAVLPSDSKKLKLSIGYSPVVEGKGRDGLFVIVREWSGERAKVVYARYLPPGEKRWIPAPIPAVPASGVKREVIVHPVGNANGDWLGWGITSDGDDFFGFKKVYPPVEMNSSETPPRKSTGRQVWDNIEIYEKKRSLTGETPVINRIGPDEIEWRQPPGSSLKGFNFKHGWRNYDEVKQIMDKSPDLNANNAEYRHLVYAPWGFKIGLWASLVSLLSLVLLLKLTL